MTHQLIDVPALNATHAAPSRSDRYKFYSTRDLIQPLLDDSWEVTQCFQVHSKKPSVFGKHLLRLSHPKLQLGTERLEAVIKNSHDGSSRFEFSLGAWRFICSNGIMIGSSFATVSIQHTRAFEAVQECAAQLIDQAPEVASMFDAWRSRETSDDERHAFAIAAAFVRWGEQPPIDPRELLVPRRVEDQPNNLWVIFNRLQENLMQGGVTRQNDHRRTRGIKAIDETIRVNRGLWKAGEALYGTVSDLALPS